MKHDRRAKKRFQVNDGALAFVDKVPGTIIDISEAGIAVNYVVFEKEPETHFILDLFFEGDDFFLTEIKTEVVTNTLISAASWLNGAEVRRLGLRFCELKNEKKDQLRYFILHNTSCEV